MKVIPANILKCMPKHERVPLGRAGMTAGEVDEKLDRKAERFMQEQMRSYLDRNQFIYLNPRMDRATNLPLGWPDFTIRLKNGRWLMVEVKTERGKVRPDQVDWHTKYYKWTGDVVRIVRSYHTFTQLVERENDLK